MVMAFGNFSVKYCHHAVSRVCQARTLRLVRLLRMTGRTMQEFPLSDGYLIGVQLTSARATAWSTRPQGRSLGTIHPGASRALWGTHPGASTSRPSTAQ